jgi:hypothetical protein
MLHEMLALALTCAHTHQAHTRHTSPGDSDQVSSSPPPATHTRFTACHACQVVAVWLATQPTVRGQRPSKLPFDCCLTAARLAVSAALVPTTWGYGTQQHQHTPNPNKHLPGCPPHVITCCAVLLCTMGQCWCLTGCC